MSETAASGISRRGFLKTLAAGATAVAATPTSARPASGGPSHRSSTGKIGLGAVSWNFRSIMAGPPWTVPIDACAELGFEAVELICAKVEQLDATLAEPHFSNLMRQLERTKIAVSQFVLFQSMVADLGSRDAEKRKRALEVFAKGCKVAAKLGAPIINIVAPWPTVYHKRGWGYLPRYYSTGTTMPGPKFRFDVPRNFDWDKAWSDFVAVMKEATAVAKADGLRFSLENHTHTFVQGPDAFLRLWDEVRDPALGMNLDVGWLQLQREYPVVGIYKVRNHLMNVHLRDIDGFAYRFVPPGSGCMDFAGIVAALRDIGFSGYASFEQDGVPDMKEALRRGKRILERYLAMSRDELETAAKRS